MVPQGSFNLYSDGIEHGCRLVAELPLYSYPTTPLTEGDQIQFSNIFHILEEHGDDEEEGSGTGVADGEEMMVTDDPLSIDFGGDATQVSSVRFADIDNGTVDIADISQFQEIPFPEDLLSGPAITVFPQKERSHSKATHTSSSHKTVYPDTATDSFNVRYGTTSLDCKAKPPLEIEVASADGIPKTTSNGLRFLIVVSRLYPRPFSLSSKLCGGYFQDDSALNRKTIRRILESERSRFSNATIEEADDGTSAVSAVERAAEAGLTFDFIFMDFVMVSVLIMYCRSLNVQHTCKPTYQSQINMNGPDAVKILRNDLKFRRTIIGG